VGWLVTPHNISEKVIYQSSHQHHENLLLDTLLTEGVAFKPSQWAQEDLHFDSNWREFKNHWDRLKIDNYMKDNGKYRERRYSTLFYDSNNGVVKKPYMPLFKSSLYNSFAGDQFRYFAETELTLYSNYYFLNVLSLALDLFNTYEIKDNKLPKWFIEVDQYRIKAEENRLGKPTPEGVHSDGTSYFLLMLVSRENIVGGESTIYNSEMDPVLHKTLKNPGDILLLNDRDMFHGVSDIATNSDKGHRDILHISFTNLNSDSAICRRFGLERSVNLIV